MAKVVGVRREDLDKRGEMRVALTPKEVRQLTSQGYQLLVQSGLHPVATIEKRAFSDQEYLESGATIVEDLSEAEIIFGVKEIRAANILPQKAYVLFSHTHKGQAKNRESLKALVEQDCTLIDYELITDEENARLLKTFTFFGGYAGMIDALWTFGKRMALEGQEHPFSEIPQSIAKGDLGWFHEHLAGKISTLIRDKGTPANLPPMITCILGCGKTSYGAQDIYDRLPTESIDLSQLADTFAHGDRHKVYKLVLEVYDIYRLRPDAAVSPDALAALSDRERKDHYIAHPEMYESNLDQVLPFVSLLMNCILWSPAYPRVVTNALISDMAQQHDTLKVIGDVSCDPNGGIEFSRETWVSDPVFTWQAQTQTEIEGFRATDIQVMAVTNLPCAFSADASERFALELAPLLPDLLAVDFGADFGDVTLPPPIERATILWKGQLTPRFEYMKAYI